MAIYGLDALIINSSVELHKKNPTVQCLSFIIDQFDWKHKMSAILRIDFNQPKNTERSWATSDDDGQPDNEGEADRPGV